MAVNLETLKNSKYIAVLGIALIGGIYLASKMRGKPQQDTPQEVAPIVQSVADTSSLNQVDETQRKLTDTETKYNQLLSSQEDYQKQFELTLANKDKQSQTEREQFQQRLLLQQQQLGQQYGAQLSSLQAAIKTLKEQLIAKTPTSKSVPTQGVVTPQKQTVTAKYPGYPGGIPHLDNPNPAGLNFATFDAYAHAHGNAGNKTFQARGMVSHITAGIGGSNYILNAGQMNPATYAMQNRGRVARGLLPLTESEFQAMQNDMRSWSGNEKDSYYTSGEYARLLWEKWDRPYQYSNSVKRF